MNTEVLTVNDTHDVHPFPLDVQNALTPRDASSPVGDDAIRARLGASDFFAGKSLAELAREQGVGTVKDIAVFAGGIPEYEDVDELLAQLEAMRAC